MKAPAARARRWKEARRSRAAERDASGGGAPRASENAGLSVRLGIIRVAAMTAAVLIGGGSKVLACTMCFGAEESWLIDGAKLGVLVMMGITFAVQGAFVGFFLYLRKRAKQNAAAERDIDIEWSEFQRASRTS